MRTVGFFPMSATDSEVLGIDFAPSSSGRVISSASVTGVNCTATLVSITGLVVAVRVTNGTYAGSAEVTVTWEDGKPTRRQIDLRFM